MKYLRDDGGVCAIDGGLGGHLHIALSGEMGLRGTRHALVLRLGGGGDRPHPPAGLGVHAALGLQGSRPPVGGHPLVGRMEQGMDLLGRRLWRPAA